MRTASRLPLFAVASALALACVTMVPVAHAGVRVWMDNTWDVSDGTASCRTGRDYCRNAFDEYRPQVAVRYVVIHPKTGTISRINAAPRKYVLQRVEAGDRNMDARRTVVPAPARQSQRVRVVSTSRSVSQVTRAWFEAKRVIHVSEKRAQNVSAKQQSAPVRVVSTSAKQPTRRISKPPTVEERKEGGKKTGSVSKDAR